MDEVLNSNEIKMLFIRECHLKNLSCIIITQNIFAQSKHARTINLNTHYLVLFRNYRDSSQISNLGRQIYPGQVKLLQDIYIDATRAKYGYLLIDMSPHAENVEYRLRTRIMPGEDTVVYIPTI